MTNLENFTQTDIDIAYKIMIKALAERGKLFSNGDPPSAYLLAGQPGAGKTVLSAYIADFFKDNIVLVNGDEYRRYHPNYRELYKVYGADSANKTAQFSSAAVERCIKEFSDRRYNLIIEGTGRTYEVPKSTSELLSSKGYNVEMMVIAARPEQSLFSTVKRFYAMDADNTAPRATAVESHDIVVEKLPENLNKLRDTQSISRIRIMDREAALIYDSDSSELPPGEALQNYWNRPWTESELQNLSEEIEKLEKIASANGAKPAHGSGNFCMGSVITELKKEFFDRFRRGTTGLYPRADRRPAPRRGRRSTLTRYSVVSCAR